MGSSNARAVFDRGTDAFNAHDIGAFARLMADDVELKAPGGVALRGRGQVAAFYGAWLDAFPDARVDITAAHVIDDVVVEEGVFRGTQRAALRAASGDIPATGRAASVEYIQVLRIRADAVASFHLMFDNLELLQQLGVATAFFGGAAASQRAETQDPVVQAH